MIVEPELVGLVDHPSMGIAILQERERGCVFSGTDFPLFLINVDMDGKNDGGFSIADANTH